MKQKATIDEDGDLFARGRPQVCPTSDPRGRFCNNKCAAFIQFNYNAKDFITLACFPQDVTYELK